MKEDLIRTIKSMIFFITTIHIYLLKHIIDSGIQCLFEDNTTCKLFRFICKDNFDELQQWAMLFMPL